MHSRNKKEDYKEITQERCSRFMYVSIWIADPFLDVTTIYIIPDEAWGSL